MADDSLIIDLTNYKDRVGSRVPPARYRVQVEDAENDKSSNGNPMVNLWLRIVGGEYDGHTIVDRLVITDRSLFRVVGFMQAIGLPTPKKRLKINIRQFLGKTLDVDIEDGEPYNGRVKSEVRGYLKVAGGSAPAQEDEDLDEDVSDEPTDEDEEPQKVAKAKRAAAAPSPEEAEDIEEIDLDEVTV